MISQENLRLFVLSTIVAIALTIWSLLAAEGSLVTVLMSAQLLVLCGIGALSVFFWRRSRRDRAQLGVRRLLSERRLGRELEYAFMEDARRSLVLVGIVHRTLWSDKARFEVALEKAARSGAVIRVYFVAPGSKHLERRALEEHESPEDWGSHIRQAGRLFLEFQRRHPDAKIELYTYDQYPVWHLVLRDEREGFVGWYAPQKHGYDSPVYECALEAEGGLATPALQWFRSMQLDATRFHP